MTIARMQSKGLIRPSQSSPHFRHFVPLAFAPSQASPAKPNPARPSRARASGYARLGYSKGGVAPRVGWGGRAEREERGLTRRPRLSFAYLSRGNCSPAMAMAGHGVA